MNYNGAGVLDFVLLGIDHIEEVEDTAWVCGYAVVRPGQEVELVHTPGLLPLCTKMPETLKFSKAYQYFRMYDIHTYFNFLNLAWKKKPCTIEPCMY